MRIIVLSALLWLAGAALMPLSAQAGASQAEDEASIETALKQLVTVRGLRSNQLIGYGLVVGLAGTGDSKGSGSRQSIRNYLKKLGYPMPPENQTAFQGKNVAAVMITAELPAVHRQGDRLDVQVSSIGDAKSLAGGLLIQSPLKGADGQIYAVAQGALTGPAASKNRGRRDKVPRGLLIEGAAVERSFAPVIIENNRVELVLRRFDPALAVKITDQINTAGSFGQAALQNDGIISVELKGQPAMAALAGLMQLKVAHRLDAVVVINEKTGTIVIGGEVIVAPAAVSQRNLQVTVNRGPFEYGSKLDDEGSEGLLQIGKPATVKDMVDLLNKAGASTTEIIAIIKALQQAGAIQAEIKIL